MKADGRCLTTLGLPKLSLTFLKAILSQCIHSYCKGTDRSSGTLGFVPGSTRTDCGKRADKLDPAR